MHMDQKPVLSTISNTDDNNNSSLVPRRRPDLSLPIPPHRPQTTVSPVLPQRPQPINFLELERSNRIGNGSDGTVYQVFHPPTSNNFVLKVIHSYHEKSRICCLIEILRDIDNLNIVKCHDMFDHNGEIQVLLEYMDGGSLESTHISHEPTLADITRQILTGLCYLHRRKIVHRDIKPSNLLKNAKNQVKIDVFGMSGVPAQTMDQNILTLRTIAYMSPERINTDLKLYINDERYAEDIWSLGVCILELYLGRFPFPDGNWVSLMWAISMSQPPEAPTTASLELRDFLACCLQTNPARRWTAARLLRHPFVSGAKLSVGDQVQVLLHQQLPTLFP